MKTYIGKFTKGRAIHEVFVSDDPDHIQGRPRRTPIDTEPVPLPHHVRHSPGGFNWGYNGSGPSELARCILIDHLLTQRSPLWTGADDRELDRLVPPYLYQSFKAEFVATWPMDQNWVLSGDQIEEWLEEKTL